MVNMASNSKLMIQAKHQATLKLPSRLVTLVKWRNPSSINSISFSSSSNPKVSLKCSTTDKIAPVMADASDGAADVTDGGAVLPPTRLNNIASPWLRLPPQIDEATGEKLECFYSLADGQTLRLNRKKSLKVPDTAKCIGSTMGWLGYVDTKDNCSVYLTNPYVDNIVELPSLEKLPCVLGVKRDPKTGDILRFKVRDDHCESLWGEFDVDPYGMFDPYAMSYHIHTIALSDPNPRDEDCIAMILQGDNAKTLAYCPISKKYNSSTVGSRFDLLEDYTDEWIGLQEEEYKPYVSENQMVYSYGKHLFYTLNSGHGIMAFDLQSDRGRRSKRVSQFPQEDLKPELKREFYEEEKSEVMKALRKMCHKLQYLVTFENGDLLLIVRHYQYFGNKAIPAYKTLHFDVFRVCYPSTLERLSSVGDRAIFIGANQSFAIKARYSPGVNPDCIYFTDDLPFRLCEPHAHASHRGHDNGIFSIKDGSITCYFPYNDAEQEKKVSMPVPIFWVAPLDWGLASLHDLDDQDLSEEG